MSNPSKKKTMALIASITLLAIAGVLVAPVAVDLHRISTVRDEFRLDNAVSGEIAKDPSQLPMKAEDFLDPPFMARYGLLTKDYLNAKGYFSPTGVHWKKWNLETRTAALLMWGANANISSRHIRQNIRLIDDYYSRNEQTAPIIDVFKAAVNLESESNRSNFDLPFWLAAFGLALTSIGAFLLYHFGAPPLKVTESGEKLVDWTASGTEAERLENIRRFEIFTCWSRAGIFMLALGSLLQFVSLIFDKIM